MNLFFPAHISLQMHIAFKFRYIHDNALFSRLLESIREKSTLELLLSKEMKDYIIEASGNQSELEALAELVSRLIPQSLFLSKHSIEEIKRAGGYKPLAQQSTPYMVPYCPQCQDMVIKTLDPFEPCLVCGFSDLRLSFEELNISLNREEKRAEVLFDEMADSLMKEERLSLRTYNGMRTFSLLGTKEKEEMGVLICDPSEISASFVITQDELDTLMMVEKPSLRLKPKIKFRAENDLEKPFYPVFLADDKITLALSLALSRKGVFAVYCDKHTSLRAASALQERVIIGVGRDMLPWKHPMAVNQAVSCTFDGFTAYGDSQGLLLDTAFEPSGPCVKFVSNEGSSSPLNAVAFAPSHAALRSIVLEHDIQGKPLCGVYLSRQHDSQICSYSSKIGYTPHW